MPQKPNFVVVFMDDMGYGDMGCFGSSVIRTPQMDSIAEQGARFTSMYSAAAICSPSRAGLLTGKQPQRIGIERVLFPHDKDGIGASVKTVADYLQYSGYKTMMAGKWHIGCLPEHNPVEHGFDEYCGLLYSNDMEPLHLYRDQDVIETEVDQAFLTRRYTDEAINFINRNSERAFFCYIAHTMPHIPLHVEPEFRNTSRGGTYGDTIECIDYHLGRLTDEIDRLNLTENTFIIVTSDNGPWYEGSAGGLRGRKFDLYEGGVRMPFVARFPKLISPGTCSDEPASLMDIPPTFLNLAGVDPEKNDSFDGIDITESFKGNPMPERDGIYFYDHYSPNAIRSGKWKLHLAFGADRNKAEMPQLFDLEHDPQESYNLANLYPEIVEKLSDRIRIFHNDVRKDNSDCPDVEFEL